MCKPSYEDLRQATGYGRADGLKGVNCRHDFHPFIPGSAGTWSDKELKALEEKRYTYNGKKMTEYEASQEQRKIERAIRTQKRKVAALEAIGEDASAERKMLREAQKSYTDFSEQTGMKKQSARTQIASKKAEREVKAANKTAGVKPTTKKSIEARREEIPTNAVAGGRQYTIDPVTTSQRNGEIVSKNTAQPLTNSSIGGKISIQFFAEKDIANQDSNSLKRAMRKFEKRIVEHERKIETPEDFIDGWAELDPRKQQGLIKHWRKEIRNFRTSIDDRKSELEKRGEADE